MQVKKEHFIDKPPPDEPDQNAYYYEGDNYTITLNDVEYRCRSYEDEPDQINFISREFTSPLKRFFKGKFFSSVPYGDSSFSQAVDYLKSQGFQRFVMITRKGRIEVQLDKFGHTS